MHGCSTSGKSDNTFHFFILRALNWLFRHIYNLEEVLWEFLSYLEHEFKQFLPVLEMADIVIHQFWNLSQDLINVQVAYAFEKRFDLWLWHCGAWREK